MKQAGCEVCGGQWETLFYRRGSEKERVMCRKHARAAISGMHADGWQSQAATVARSATGRAIRQHLQRSNGQ